MFCMLFYKDTEFIKLVFVQDAVNCQNRDFSMVHIIRLGLLTCEVQWLIYQCFSNKTEGTGYEEKRLNLIHIYTKNHCIRKI